MNGGANKPTEDELCGILAEAVKSNPKFMSWLLSRTKFAHLTSNARLLHEEQMAIRPRKQWWRHWWCHVPELSKDRETDIFMVFETLSKKFRFALHIEVKKDNSQFTEGQADAYKPRALYMLGKDEYLNYSDFSTILVAPAAFCTKFQLDCDKFDRKIYHREIAKFLPLFEEIDDHPDTKMSFAKLL